MIIKGNSINRVYNKQILIFKLVEVIYVPGDEDTARGVDSLEGVLQVTSEGFDIALNHEITVVFS